MTKPSCPDRPLPLNLRRRHLIELGFFGIAVAALTNVSLVHAGDEYSAPNTVRIHPKLITSGQPSAEVLKTLKQHSIQAVIYLVPSNTSGEVPDEALILKQQGIQYVHIPIPFRAPSAQHYAAFAEAMAKYADQHVLVHCEINLRASSMVFLYRTIALKEDPQRAFDSVSKVWSPRGAWKPYLDEMLKKNGVRFSVY